MGPVFHTFFCNTCKSEKVSHEMIGGPLRGFMTFSGLFKIFCKRFSEFMFSEVTCSCEVVGRS